MASSPPPCLPGSRTRRPASRQPGRRIQEEGLHGSLKTEKDGRPPGPRTPPSAQFEGDLVSWEAVCLSSVERERAGSGGRPGRGLTPLNPSPRPSRGQHPAPSTKREVRARSRSVVLLDRSQRSVSLDPAHEGCLGEARKLLSCREIPGCARRPYGRKRDG